METTMKMHQRNLTKTRTASSLLVLTCFTAFMGTALAASPNDARPQRVVEFSDLNLRGTSGIKILYQRIEAAAHEVCDSTGERELAQVVRWHLCLDQAVGRAVNDLSIPALTSYHMAKTGRSVMATTVVAKQP
jgi:UrcA family protein